MVSGKVRCYWWETMGKLLTESGGEKIQALPRAFSMARKAQGIDTFTAPVAEISWDITRPCS